MSHKILIELDEKQEAVLREIAEYDEVSLSYAASQLFGDYLLKLEPFMSDMKGEAERKPTIYISGPITNDPDYKAKFAEAAHQLRTIGYEVLSPPEHVQVAEGKEWEDYMAEALVLMLKADQIYMLKGWSASRGARLERRLAQELGMGIKYE